MTIDQAFAAAVQHHQSGQLREAEALYRQILDGQPGHADAMHLLGVIAFQVGRYDPAAELISRAIALQPTVADYHANLGLVLAAQGKTQDAIAIYRRALALDPQLAETHNNLGNALKDAGEWGQAIAAYREALRLRPEYPEAHNNLGNALHEAGKVDEAIESHRRALAARPAYAEAHNNLGNALRSQRRLDDAIASYERALALEPYYPDACNNLGNALYAKARYDEARSAYDRALQLKPDFALAQWNRALVLLLQGDYELGWEQWEARWQSNEFRPYRRNFPQPRWGGEPLHGKRILLYTEQGFGDTIHFIRYAPLVARQGARVIVQCQPELLSLLREIAGIEGVFSLHEPVPEFDVHCPLLSVPGLMNTTRRTIPAEVPYLQPDARKVEFWRDKIASDPSAAGKRKIGLSWGGRPLPDPGRSMPLSTLAPLAAAPDAWFCSLQKGDAAREADSPRSGLGLANWADALHDFADTAALIANLDVVVTIDSAVAHLAGALGKPVMLMLPFSADWRWMLDRSDSPWYPTMRLFRQDRPGDWSTCIGQIAQALGANSPA
jgi:tetratricopeptide (TPR) repeat protein